MTQEQVDRMTLGWSHEQLARASGVTVAAVYLLERMGYEGSEDDIRIRKCLAVGKAKHSVPYNGPASHDLEQSPSDTMHFPTLERFASSDRKEVVEKKQAGDGDSASPADMA